MKLSFKPTIPLGLIWCLLVLTSSAQQNQKRDRGESFYQILNANTQGSGNIWLTCTAIGHVWDDAPINLNRDTTATAEVSTRKWISNVRAFPELYLRVGILNALSLHLETRPLSWGFGPGWFGGGIKCTYPNNSELRRHSFGLDVSYAYQMREINPTLGGYTGFMPEGFVVKGHVVQTKLLYEFDFLTVRSSIPLRLIINSGLRLPLAAEKRQYRQGLYGLNLVYSGYGFDFFAQYTLEAFNNLFKPITFEQPGKKFLVFFSENPMYATFGGNIRYDNGLCLSLAVPLLLSFNQGSRMRPRDQAELIHNTPNGIYTYEKSLHIRDPFDPWYVKWKIVASLSFPIRFSMTGTEMMRNFLILKNRKDAIKIDIDSHLLNTQVPAVTDEKQIKKDAQRRLEKIRKKREQSQD